MSEAQDMPARIAALPRDALGPVPWFADWYNGIVDYRHAISAKLDRAIAGRRCWTCGQRLVGPSAFLVGPSGAIERVSPWPPSHLDCMQFTVRACPFFRGTPRATAPQLGQPQYEAATRLELARGIVVLWETPDHAVVAAPAGELIFQLGEPSSVTWLRKGQKATRLEAHVALVDASRKLVQLARRPGARGTKEAGIKLARARAWLPSAADGTPTDDPETSDVSTAIEGDATCQQ